MGNSRVLGKSNVTITQTYAQHVAKCEAGKGWARGLDVVGGQNVTAHTAGEVVYAVDYIKGHEQDKQAMGYGNYALIKHPGNVVNGCTFYTLYAHMLPGSVKVKPGDKVNKGQQIGKVGDTGTSFGNHLHWELRFMANDVHVVNDFWHDTSQFYWSDPTPFLNADLPSTPAQTTLTAKSYPNYNGNGAYRVRKTFEDQKTAAGSFYSWANAYYCWVKYKSKGYHVYDNDGKQLD